MTPHRGMLNSRQASNNSNQQSSLDDSGVSGVVDDHDWDHDDVTSVEDHQERPSRLGESKVSRRDVFPAEQKNYLAISDRPTTCAAPITLSVKTSKSRKIRILKYNGVKNKKQLSEIPPDYLTQIVVLGI